MIKILFLCISVACLSAGPGKGKKAKKPAKPARTAVYLALPLSPLSQFANI
jgi:hypothetical protein